MPLELPIPDEILRSDDAGEFLRAWVVDDRILCSLATAPTSDDAKVWGELLAGIALAVADQISGGDQGVIDPDVLSVLRGQLELGSGVYQLSTHMQHLAGYSSIVERFHAESDRAAAVLAGAALDDYLGEALRSFLVLDEGENELFGKYGPLSTFAARIDMSFALGLISSDLKRDFNFVRKIRNHFAHHIGDATFNQSPVRDLCQNLSTAQIFNEDGDDVVEKSPRIWYLLAVGTGIGRMGSLMQAQRKRTSPASTDAI